MVKGSRSTKRKYRSGVSIKIPKIRHTLRHTLGTGDQFVDLISLSVSIKEFADYLLFKSDVAKYKNTYDKLQLFVTSLKAEIIDKLDKIRAKIQLEENARALPAGGAGMDVEKNAMNDILSRFSRLGI